MLSSIRAFEAMVGNNVNVSVLLRIASMILVFFELQNAVLSTDIWPLFVLLSSLCFAKKARWADPFLHFLKLFC